MSEEVRLKTITDLSEEVISFLNDAAGFDYVSEFLKKYQLEANQDSEVINIVLETVLGQVVLADLPEEIEIRLGLSADQALQAAIDLAGHRLLPISGVVGNVAEQIKNWGGDLERFKGEGKVVVPELTALSFVQGALKDLNVKMSEDVLQHRLELILVSFAKGVRDASEAIGTMTRAQKVGGLDMAKDDAEVLLKEIDQKLAFINISFKEGGEVGGEKVGRIKVQDVKPPVKKNGNNKMIVSNDQIKVVKKVTDKQKRDPEVDQMLADLKEDQEKSKKMLAELKKAKSQKSKVEIKKKEERMKKDPEIEKMLAVLEQDQKKSKELLSQLKNRNTEALNQKDTAQTAKKDLKVEKEALTRNNGAPVAVVKAQVNKGGRETVDRAEKKNTKKLDTSILNKQAQTGLGADIFSDEDEAEIKRIASVRAKALVGQGNPTQVLIEQIIGTANLKFTDDEIKGRFEKAVDSRIRDLRDIYEVRAQLESPKDKGGLGLTGAKLAETVQVIDRLVNEYQNKLQTIEEKKKQELMKHKREQDAKLAVDTKNQQEQKMAKRYTEITGQAPTKTIMGAVTKTGTTISSEETMARQEQQIDPKKVKQAVLSAKQTILKPVRMSVASIPAGAKAQVQDVRFTRRLTGPLEELRNMTIVEFRRLSTEPEEAIEKIKDKITLVEDQGYDQKIAAIKGWRASPINQEYLNLFQEALESGKKIQDLLKEKEEGSLTHAELVAIMKLNGELHF